jgi:WS/DGAT/MGAT family acyltransferase
MSPVDAAWYHMDGPVNFAQVTAILLTREPLDFEKVTAVLRERLDRFDRFRQRVTESGFPVPKPHWEDMPDFDIGQQIHHIALPEPRNRAALANLISDLASTPLDRERPLWQAHVVDDVGSGSALIIRTHHCIADGTAAMAICEELFETRGGKRAAGRPLGRTARRGARAERPWFVPSLAVVEKAARDALSTAEAAVEALRHPRQAVQKVTFMLDGASMLFAELQKRPDPASPLKGKFGLEKRVAWSEPVALDDIKAIGAPTGAKINDVLVAGMTGALRSYLRKRGIDVNGMTVRAMVPVDLRPPGKGIELGNEFGLVVLELPVNSRRTSERLRLTRERMDALKRSPEPVAIMALFNLFGRGPKAVADLAVDLFGRKASVVMTNVAGPQQAMYLAGVPIDRFMFWVPHPGRQLGMGISIMSYKGSATLAVIADAHLVPDPEAITAGFQREFARMLKAVQRTPAKNSSARGAGRSGPASL